MDKLAATESGGKSRSAKSRGGGPTPSSLVALQPSSPPTRSYRATGLKGYGATGLQGYEATGSDPAVGPSGVSDRDGTYGLIGAEFGRDAARTLTLDDFGYALALRMSGLAGTTRVPATCVRVAARAAFRARYDTGECAPEIEAFVLHVLKALGNIRDAGGLLGQAYRAMQDRPIPLPAHLEGLGPIVKAVWGIAVHGARLNARERGRFALGTPTIGKYLGVTHKPISDAIKLLCNAKLLRKVAKHRGRVKAAKYEIDAKYLNEDPT